MTAETESRTVVGSKKCSERARRTSAKDRESPHVRVIYVAGVSHTGSTLLGHILGELEETCYAGEIRNTWQRGILDNRMCTCNASFAECPFWQAVIQRLPFPAEKEAKRLSGLRRQAGQGSLGLPFGHKRIRPADETALAAATDALYAALGDVAAVRQLVDSSKSPFYAAFLHRLPSVDVRVVHLVRDPRATVYSHLRRHHFGHRETFRRSLYWLRWNLAIERLARVGVPYSRIRYEDLVEDPAESLNKVIDALGLPGSELPIEANVVRVTPKHIFSGNRARGEAGSIPLRNDLEWKNGLPWRMQTIVRATTSPLLGRYGYRDY